MANDLHGSLFDEIESQIRTLASGAPARREDQPSWEPQEVEAALADLAVDKQTLLDHWRIQPGITTPTAPVNARECGQPQPCPHVLELAQKYGLV